MSNKWKLIIGAFVLGGIINMCSPSKTTTQVQSNQTVEPTATMQSTATLRPTRTAIPTKTKRPTIAIPTVAIPQSMIDDAKPCKYGQIKGNPNGSGGDKIYHKPTWRYYSTLKNADVQCFDTVQDAIAAGYRASKVK